MAIINQDGRLVSYSNEDIMQEALIDYLEFGNVKVVAILSLKQGVRVVIDYAFLEEYDEKLEGPQADKFESSETMDLKEMIKRMVIQDDPIRTEEELKRDCGGKIVVGVEYNNQTKEIVFD